MKIFFLVKLGYPKRWSRLIPRPGWQGLPKHPSADKEEGRTPNLISNKSISIALPGPLGCKMEIFDEERSHC